MSTLETRTMLVLSTAHLTKQTASWLDTNDYRSWPTPGGKIEYGYLVYAPEVVAGDEYPAIFTLLTSLKICLIFAREHGFEYVKFDCDAEPIDDLPSYGW